MLIGAEELRVKELKDMRGIADVGQKGLGMG